MKYDLLIIYYFSGTGNAKNASRWILDIAEKQGIKTQLINIDRFEKIEYPALTKKTFLFSDTWFQSAPDSFKIYQEISKG